MMMLKICIAEGCQKHPTFGWKADGGQEIVWACKEHQRLIWRPAVKQALVEMVAADKAEQGHLL